MTGAQASPEPRRAVEIAPGLRRVLAPNPSPMTYWGTNTYLLGAREVTVIDPGPDDPAHLVALLAALKGAAVAQIVVTHAHGDHSGLAAALAEHTGAPVLAYGSATAGRSPVMQRLAREGLVGGGEGVHRRFRPDREIATGSELATECGPLEVIHTPGHFAGHVSLALGDLLFSGDHLMAWSSTQISPPDGDLPAFLDSCAALQKRGARVALPGHGGPVADPAARLAWLVAHRAERDAEIIAALSAGPATAAALAALVYRDIGPELLPAAARTVLAHLIAAHEDGRVVARPLLSAAAEFALR